MKELGPAREEIMNSVEKVATAPMDRFDKNLKDQQSTKHAAYELLRAYGHDGHILSQPQQEQEEAERRYNFSSLDRDYFRHFRGLKLFCCWLRQGLCWIVCQSAVQYRNNAQTLELEVWWRYHLPSFAATSKLCRAHYSWQGRASVAVLILCDLRDS